MQTRNPTITEITMWGKHNYVSYNDTDSQSDCFNGYCLGVRQTVEWVKNDGGDEILVRFGNGVDCPKYRKRLTAICRLCGYSFEERQEDLHTPDGESWTTRWFVLEKIATGGLIPSLPFPPTPLHSL